MPRGCPECGAAVIAASDGIKECEACPWTSEDIAPDSERDELLEELDDEFDQPVGPVKRTRMRRDDA